MTADVEEVVVEEEEDDDEEKKKNGVGDIANICVSRTWLRAVSVLPIFPKLVKGLLVRARSSADTEHTYVYEIRGKK